MRIHGMTESPEYGVWEAMIGRCTLPKNARWSAYGARGIRVCSEWSGPGGFARFFAHVGPRPDGIDKTGRALYSIDRIDTDGNYEPGNVRWATRAEQRATQRFHTPQRTPDRVVRARQLRAGGATFQAIADQLGISIGSAWRWLR